MLCHQLRRWQTPTVAGNRRLLMQQEVTRRESTNVKVSQQIAIQLRDVEHINKDEIPVTLSKKGEGTHPTYNISREISPNPSWIGVLMGLPKDWTNLEIDQNNMLTGEGTPPSLDVYTPVAGKGEAQYPHEPPRLVKGHPPQWAKQMKTLGNGGIPHIAYLIGREIMKADSLEN